MKNCEHIEATFDRDGKECKKCGLSWRLCLKQKREAKKGVHFYPSSFYWQDSESEDTKKACDILNDLTKEQIWAVEHFGKSRFNDGYSDGYDYGCPPDE